MNEWKKYPRGRKMKEFDGFICIVPESFNEKDKKLMPVFCEVCELAFSRPDDKDAFKRFGCCSVCADSWAYSRQKDWEDGWRPSKDQISFVVQRRSVLDSTIRFE